MRATDLRGRRFGRWVVVIRADNDRHGAAMWAVRCICGGAGIIRSDALTSGKSQSCGCVSKEEDLLRAIEAPTEPKQNRAPKRQQHSHSREGLARELRGIERKRERAAAIERRLQGLSRIERRRELERLAAQVAANRINAFNQGRPAPPPKPRPNRTTVRRVIIEPVQPKVEPKKQAEPDGWAAFKARVLARAVADMKQRKVELA